MDTTEENNDKFFDEKGYSTFYINLEEKKQLEQTNNIISLLTQEANRDFKDEALKIIKAAGPELLIDAIFQTKDEKIKHILVAAFWEANMDCSKHLPFFIDLAVNNNYQVCLEVLTIVEEMQGPFNKEELKLAKEKTDKALKNSTNKEKNVLLESITSEIERHLADTI